MYRGTAGKFLVQFALPDDLRAEADVLDGKTLAKILQKLAQKGGDEYRDVVLRLMKLGKTGAEMVAGYSVGPQHLRMTEVARRHREMLRGKLDEILEDESTPFEDRKKKVVKLLTEISPKLTEDVLAEAYAAKNPLALQSKSGVRGNPTQIRSLLGYDLLYGDAQDRPIPVPILRSYSEGLTPVEYYAGSFGGRQGVVSAKLGTAKTGYLGKQLVQLAHRLVVTAKDDDPGNHDENNPRGLPVATDDPDNENALLAVQTGPYKRNTVLTPEIIADLKRRGINQLLVRSPIATSPPQGGVYGADVGVREKGDVAPIGDYVGIAAANALSEGVTQGALGKKHSGGVVTGEHSDLPSGFARFNLLFNPPEVMPGSAAHSREDGKVTKIEPAPQGGHFVEINKMQHHVPQGRKLKVAVGDEVEAGDRLSDGVPNPIEVIPHKGIGEGRRQFTNMLREAYSEAGMKASRRNIELVARGLVDLVEMDEEHGDYLPGDLVHYSRLEHSWQPRAGHKTGKPSAMAGMYLEKPVLHYSIGTRIRPSVVRELDTYGIKSIAAHPDPAPFKPRTVRAMEFLSHDEDWQTRLMGSYLERGFLDAAHRGMESDEEGTSYVPGLLRAKDFGRKGLTVGYDVSSQPKPTAPGAPASQPSLLQRSQSGGNDPAPKPSRGYLDAAH